MSIICTDYRYTVYACMKHTANGFMNFAEARGGGSGQGSFYKFGMSLNEYIKFLYIDRGIHGYNVVFAKTLYDAKY
jgi:hypothetical protein